MADYTARHAAAYRKIAAAGAAITFSREERTDYDPEDGSSTITVTSVAGVAVRMPGKAKVYDRLGLIESEAPTLLFSADIYEKPKVHDRVVAVTRSSTATYIDEDDILQSAAANILRQSHYVTANDTVRYLTVLLEAARTNLCLQSEVMGMTWVATTLAVADNSIASPDGFTTADTLTASVGNATLIQDLGIIGSAAHTFSVYLKRKTGTGDIQLTLDGGSTWTTKTITTSWVHYEITQTLANPDCGIRIVTNADAIYAWGGQAEAGSFASSYISTTSAATTRVVETINRPFTAVPQEMTAYFKFVEGGTLAGGNILGTVSGENVATKFQISGTGTVYRVIHDNGPITRIAALAAGPSIGDLVEIRAVLHSDGDVTIGQSINGAAETTATAGASATLASAWTNLTLYVGGSEVPNAGFTSFIEIKIESGTKTLDEMRAEEDPDLFHFGAYDIALGGQVVVPELGMKGEWGGTKFTVRDINPIAPAGDVIVAELVVAL